MYQARGNILFLILLAVVLFAALSYAVTSSMRGGGKDAGKESAQSQAADILNRMALLESTVSRLRMTGGCKDTEIQLINANPNTPADGHCKVFDPAGGNISVSMVTPPTSYVTSGGTSITYGASVVYGGSSTSNPSLIATYPAGTGILKAEICQAINDQLGIAAPPPSVDIHEFDTFTGDYTWVGSRIIPASMPRLACIADCCAGYLKVYQVLIAR